MRAVPREVVRKQPVVVDEREAADAVLDERVISVAANAAGAEDDDVLQRELRQRPVRGDEREQRHVLIHDRDPDDLGALLFVRQVPGQPVLAPVFEHYAASAQARDAPG